MKTCPRTLLAFAILGIPLLGHAAEPTTAPLPLIQDARLAFPPPMTTLGQVRQVMAANGGKPAVQAQGIAKPTQPNQPVPRKDREMGIALWYLVALGVLLSNGIAAVYAFRKWRNRAKA